MKLGLKIEITSQGAGSAAKTINSTPALEKYASASRSFIKEVFIEQVLFEVKPWGYSGEQE